MFISFNRGFRGTVVVRDTHTRTTTRALEIDRFTGSSGEISVEKGSTITLEIDRSSLTNDFGDLIPNAGINYIFAKRSDNYEVVGRTDFVWTISFKAESDIDVDISCYGESIER